MISAVYRYRRAVSTLPRNFHTSSLLSIPLRYPTCDKGAPSVRFISGVAARHRLRGGGNRHQEYRPEAGTHLLTGWTGAFELRAPSADKGGLPVWRSTARTHSRRREVEAVRTRVGQDALGIAVREPFTKPRRLAPSFSRSGTEDGAAAAGTAPRSVSPAQSAQFSTRMSAAVGGDSRSAEHPGRTTFASMMDMSIAADASGASASFIEEIPRHEWSAISAQVVSGRPASKGASPHWGLTPPNPRCKEARIHGASVRATRNPRTLLLR